MARVKEITLANRYRLDELLGEGAMGSVHLAWDEKEKRRVAIKLLKTATWGDEARARLREEALSLKKLSHSGVTKLLDFNEEKQHSFLVLEFIDGGNLNQYVAKNHPLPITRAIEMGVELCDALSCAHNAGIIHRDLKPDNVLLSASGKVRLTDFGLALRDDRTAQLTATGTIQGTPSFISPEQIKGSKATAQSDIYSLGCLLYFLITGEQPFKRENITETLQAHLCAKRANPRQARSECPQALAQVIAKAMSIDSSDRFTDCQQFKRTLCELDINSSQAMATFKSQAEFPKAPIIEKTTKSKCQWFCFFAISVLAFLSFKFFVAQEPVETKALKLRLWPTTVEVKWPLASKSPCQCELMSGTKTLQTQRETRSIKEHIFLFRALTPGQDYKVVLESDKARKSINFVTPLPKLTKPVLSFAINGHLFLDFSSNVKNGLTVVYGWRNEEQNSVVLNDCKDVRRSFYFNEKKREELADALVCWTVELNKNTLAKGEVCAEKFVTSRWTPLKTRRRRGTLNMPLSHGREFFFTPQDNREQMTALSLAGSGFKRLWAAKLYGHTLEREEIDFDHLRKPVITKDEKLVTLSLVNEPLNYHSRAALFLLDHQARAKRWQRLFGQEFKVKRPVQLDDKENECNQLIKGKEYFHLFQSDDISYPGQATYLLDDDTLIFNAITKKMSFLFVSFSLSERKVNWIKSCSLDKLLNSPSASPADSLSMRTKSTASRSWLRQDSKILRYRDSIYTIATHFNNKTGKHHQMLVSCSLNEKNENARVHFRFSNNKCDNWSLICPQKGIFVFALGPSIVHWSPNSKGEGAAKAIHLGKLLAQAWGDKTAPVHILVSSPQVIKGELLLVHKEIGQNPQRNDIIKTARVKHNLSGCKIKNGQLVICKYLDNVHSKCFPDDRDVFLYTYEDHCLLQLRDLLFIYRPGQRTCSHYSFPVRISYYPRFVHSLVNDDGYLFASSRVGQLGVLPLALADALKKPIAKPKEVVIQNDALKELCLQLSL